MEREELQNILNRILEIDRENKKQHSGELTQERNRLTGKLLLEAGTITTDDYYEHYNPGARPQVEKQNLDGHLRLVDVVAELRKDGIRIPQSSNQIIVPMLREAGIPLNKRDRYAVIHPDHVKAAKERITAYYKPRQRG